MDAKLKVATTNRGWLLDHVAKLVYSVVLTEGSVSQREIAELTGLHRNTVRNAVGELVTAGYLAVDPLRVTSKTDGLCQRKGQACTYPYIRSRHGVGCSMLWSFMASNPKDAYSYSYLSKCTGLSRRSVVRYWRELEDDGWIEVGRIQVKLLGPGVKRVEPKVAPEQPEPFWNDRMANIAYGVLLECEVKRHNARRIVEKWLNTMMDCNKFIYAIRRHYERWQANPGQYEDMSGLIFATLKKQKPRDVVVTEIDRAEMKQSGELAMPSEPVRYSEAQVAQLLRCGLDNNDVWRCQEQAISFGAVERGLRKRGMWREWESASAEPSPKGESDGVKERRSA